MKKTLSLFIGLIAITAMSQTTEKISLNWKIAPGDTLHYLTIMDEIDTSEINFDWSILFKNSQKQHIEKTQKLLKEITENFKKTPYQTSLVNSGKGVINIIIQTTAKESFDNVDLDNLDELNSVFEDNFYLNGSVYETGKIYSFWVDRQQKNIIALFFELPETKVGVGDSWNIDVNCINSIAQSFTCDTAGRTNKVSLIKLKHKNNETIAVLKYDIFEFVEGSFNTTFSGGTKNKQKIAMKCTFMAIAEFSVNQGQWISYNGIMSIETKSMINHIIRKKFALIKE